MAIKFIVDSASDFSPSEAENLGLHFLPLTVMFGEEEFKDGIDITKDEFYDRLINGSIFPSTSQVTPHQFEEAYREIIDSGDIPFVFTVSSGLSGTYSSAKIASLEFDEKIYIVDTLSASMGERILVEHALSLLEKGFDADYIFDELEKKKKDVGIYYILDTLEYVHKGGRLSKVGAIAAHILNIKAIISVDEDGKVILSEKARGTKKIVEAMKKLIEKNCPDTTLPYKVSCSVGSDTILNLFKPIYKDIFDSSELDAKIMGSSIGTHAGPGSVGIAFFKK